MNILSKLQCFTDTFKVYLGPCKMHFSSLVSSSRIWLALFILCLPFLEFYGFVGEASSPPINFTLTIWRVWNLPVGFLIFKKWLVQHLESLVKLLKALFWSQGSSLDSKGIQGFWRLYWHNSLRWLYWFSYPLNNFIMFCGLVLSALGIRSCLRVMVLSSQPFRSSRPSRPLCVQFHTISLWKCFSFHYRWSDFGLRCASALFLGKCSPCLAVH